MSSSPATFTVPRGMRDFYPEEMADRNRLFGAWRTAAERFGFLPYDAPIVEHLDLLKRKSGEDIVKQIYAFQDKSGRDLALRPEMTPSLARMVAARQGSLTFPLKWYTIAQCFRYERTTRGRKREHYQWNLDIIGEASTAAEAEVIAAAVEGLALAGLTSADFTVFYNSRRLLADLLASLEIPPELHAGTFLALDKKGKVSDAELEGILCDAGHSQDQCRAVFRLVDVADIEQAAAMLPGDSDSVVELLGFRDRLADYGLADAVKFDIGVVRGLAYYTGIVFEAFDTDREFRAIFGGGRYDDLLGELGSKPQTGVGLGFGDVVVGELLEHLDRRSGDAARADVAVGYMQDAQRGAAIRLATALREEGQKVDLALAAEKAKRFFGRVGDGAFTEAIYIGPDDLEAGRVRVKNLTTREERELPLT